MTEQTIPAEPGPHVTAVIDRDGDTWRRCICDGNDGWADGDYVRTWAGLWHNHGPLTAPHD